MSTKVLHDEDISDHSSTTSSSSSSWSTCDIDRQTNDYPYGRAFESPDQGCGKGTGVGVLPLRDGSEESFAFDGNSGSGSGSGSEVATIDPNHLTEEAEVESLCRLPTSVLDAFSTSPRNNEATLPHCLGPELPVLGDWLGVHAEMMEVEMEARVLCTRLCDLAKQWKTICHPLQPFQWLSPVFSKKQTAVFLRKRILLDEMEKNPIQNEKQLFERVSLCLVHLKASMDALSEQLVPVERPISPSRESTPEPTIVVDIQTGEGQASEQDAASVANSVEGTPFLVQRVRDLVAFTRDWVSRSHASRREAAVRAVMAARLASCESDQATSRIEEEHEMDVLREELYELLYGSVDRMEASLDPMSLASFDVLFALRPYLRSLQGVSAALGEIPAEMTALGTVESLGEGSHIYVTMQSAELDAKGRLAAEQAMCMALARLACGAARLCTIVTGEKGPCEPLQGHGVAYCALESLFAPVYAHRKQRQSATGVTLRAMLGQCQQHMQACSDAIAPSTLTYERLISSHLLRATYKRGMHQDRSGTKPH